MRKKQKHQLNSAKETDRFSKNWKKLTAILSGAVILGTMSLLSLPALTLTKDSCELTEHQHTEECYEAAVVQVLTCEAAKNLHQHTEDCYDEEGNLICGQADFVVHTHDAFCYDADGNLVCPLPEIKEHIHTDSCYTQEETITEGHHHTDECYAWTYELTGSMETGEAYETDLLSDGYELTDGEDEFELGSGETYEYVRGDLICGQEETEAAVTRSEPVLICDKTEIKLHTHTEQCVGTCTELEIKEHQHTEACFTEYPGEPVLICGQEEHMHDENCMPEETSAEELQEEEESLSIEKTDTAELQSSGEQMTESEDSGEDGDILEEEDADLVGAAEEPETQVFMTADSKDEEETEQEELDQEEADPEDAESEEGEQEASENEQDSGEDGDVSEEEDDGEIDFTDWIKSVSIEKRSNDWSAWEEVTDGSIQKDDQLRFYVEYTIPGYQLDRTHETIKYPIPEGINVINETSGTVHNSTGQEIGTYTIADGYIHITFNDTIADDDAMGESINGYIRFTAKVDESKLDDLGNTNIQFSESVTLNLHVEDQQLNTEDLQVEKKAVSVNSGEGTVTYQIEVTSENGTAGEVTLQDVMSNVQLDDGTIAIEGITNPDIENTESGFNITLPQMSKNGKYTITYTARIPDEYVNGTVWAQNTVSVDSTRSDGAKLHDDQTITTNIEHKLLEKTGIKNENGKIQWTIVVNTAGADISGWTLSDQMNDIPWTGTVSVSPSINGQSEITLPYTFPEGAHQTYTITYETDAEKKPGYDQAINTAILTPDEGEQSISVDGWGWIGDGTFDPLRKTADISDASDRTPDSDGNITLPWTLTVDTSEGALAAGWVLYDELENGQWFTFDQLQTYLSAFNGLNYTMKAWLLKPNGEKGEEVTSLTDGRKYKAIQLTFTDVLEKGNTYTVHYTSTAPVSGVGAKSFFNKATINDSFEHKPRITYSVSTTPTIEKYDANNPDVQGKTTHDYDTEKKTPAWYIDVTIPAGFQDGRLTVDEILPDGVEMSALSYEEDGVSYVVGDVSSDTEVYYEFNSSKTTMHIRIPEAVAGNDTDTVRVLRFRIDVTFAENVSWTDNQDGTESKDFRNYVQLLDKKGKRIEDDSQTQDFSRSIVLPTMAKSAGTVKDNIIPYTLEINPYGEDLVPNAATLTLEDVLKYQPWNDVWYSATLVPGSVHVYYRNADGTAGEELSVDDYTQHYVELEDASDPYNPPKYTRMLTLTIPDSTPLIVQYNYLIHGTLNIYPNFENTATLKGVSEEDTSTSVTTNVHIQDSEAGADANGIILYKVDSDNTGLGLAGAEFRLWKWSKTTEQYEPVTIDGSEIYTTPSNGMLHITDLDYNTAYMLQEVEAPEGYQLDDTEYYFMLKHSDTNTYPVIKPTDFQGDDRFMGDLIYRSNTEIPMGPELPETGGTGTIPYTIGGLLMMLSAGFLYYKKNLCRKEGRGSP